MKKRESKQPTYRLRGDRVRELRGAESQTDFAVRADLKAASVVSDVEREVVDVTGRTLWKLCVGLNCSADFLLGLSDVAERR